MKFEHRGWTIELFLVRIHYPNYPYKRPEEARAVWETLLNGETSCATMTGDREEVFENLKAYVDWRIDDPEMKNIF